MIHVEGDGGVVQPVTVGVKTPAKAENNAEVSTPPK